MPKSQRSQHIKLTHSKGTDENRTKEIQCRVWRAMSNGAPTKAQPTVQKNMCMVRRAHSHTKEWRNTKETIRILGSKDRSSSRKILIILFWSPTKITHIFCCCCCCARCSYCPYWAVGWLNAFCLPLYSPASSHSVSLLLSSSLFLILSFSFITCYPVLPPISFHSHLHCTLVQSVHETIGAKFCVSNVWVCAFIFIHRHLNVFLAKFFWPNHFEPSSSHSFSFFSFPLIFSVFSSFFSFTSFLLIVHSCRVCIGHELCTYFVSNASFRLADCFRSS